MNICPKCQYKRKEVEQSPDWQCPSCGIAYDKIEDIKQRQKESDSKYYKDMADQRRRVKIHNSGNWFIFPVVLLFLLFLLFNKSDISVLACGSWSIIFGILAAVSTHKISESGMTFDDVGDYKTKEEAPISFNIELFLGISGAIFLIVNGFFAFFNAGCCS
jgi:rubredoxin